MIKTRICIGLAVLPMTVTPLYLLSKVTYGIRYGILTKIYDDADMVFPKLAGFLWKFGPLDWWSYITPVALAIGTAFRIPSAFRLSTLCLLLAYSIVQSTIILGAFLPFVKFGEVMGIPMPAPYPTVPLLINIGMVVSSVLFAALSIKRSFRIGLTD